MAAAQSKGRCPVCKSATEHDFRPFCSKRCADVDLGKWLTGSYAIPAAPDADGDEDGDDMVASSQPSRRPAGVDDAD